MKSSLYVVSGLALITGAGTWLSAIPELNERPKDAKASLDAHESHASSSLLGQFRTSISSWLWVRADLYLHNGVQMRPMTEAEKTGGVKHQGAAATESHLKEDQQVLTVIPSAERDFRGWAGDVDRAVNAYQDMTAHTHNDGAVALPLFRLMTWTDPQFVPGWVIGASIIAHDESVQAYPKAHAYLLEGLENNPTSIAILTEIARLRLQEKKDFATAVSYLEQARAAWNDQKRANEDDLEAMVEAFRWLALSYRELEKFDLMRERAKEGLTIFPDDAPLQRMSVSPPLMLRIEHWREWYAGKI